MKVEKYATSPPSFRVLLTSRIRDRPIAQLRHLSEPFCWSFLAVMLQIVLHKQFASQSPHEELLVATMVKFCSSKGRLEEPDGEEGRWTLHFKGLSKETSGREWSVTFFTLT